MVRHVLLLKPRATTTDEAIEECRRALEGLVGRIPGLLDFHWGPNVAPVDRTEELSFGFSMDFAERASLDAYGPHPEHKIAAAKVRSAFERIVVFDFAL